MSENAPQSRQEPPEGGSPGTAESEVARDLERDVTVGGETYRLRRFRGFKALRIMREARELAKAYPEISKVGADFEREYIDANALRLSRTEAEQRLGEAAASISEEAWETTGGEHLVRRLPSTQERMAAIFPTLLDIAEDRVLTLLALVSLTNEELEEADNADNVDGAIRDRSKLLLHSGEIPELVELAKAGLEVGRAQFAPLEGLAGKAMPLLAAAMGLELEAPAKAETETESSTDGSTSTSSETKPPSSTASPTPSPGPAATSSSASPGSSSDASPPA